MQYKTVTPMGAEIRALDMLGRPVEPFTPFSVRCPQFIQLKDGTILYFFEAKYHSQSDEAPSCKVMLRSHDGGNSWGEARILSYEEFPYFVGGAPVYDAMGDALLYVARSRHWKPGCERDRLITEEDQVLDRVDERFWVTRSTDGGLSWSRFREFFLDGPQEWRVRHCITPGMGIQLSRQQDPARNGRLILPANHLEGDLETGTRFGSHLLISDDGGQSWRTGAVQRHEGGNECMAVELADGEVLINSRTHGSIPANLRLQSRSRDGGDSFCGCGPVDSLYDPCSSAGFAVARWGGREAVFFMVPSGELEAPWDFLGKRVRWGRREAMVLHRSDDGGRTYRPILQLSPRGEFAAYAAMLVTAEGRLLCAWESGPEIGLYRDIRCAVYSLEELMAL